MSVRTINSVSIGVNDELQRGGQKEEAHLLSPLKIVQDTVQHHKVPLTRSRM